MKTTSSGHTKPNTRKRAAKRPKASRAATTQPAPAEELSAEEQPAEQVAPAAAAPCKEAAGAEAGRGAHVMRRWGRRSWRHCSTRSAAWTLIFDVRPRRRC